METKSNKPAASANSAVVQNGSSNNHNETEGEGLAEIKDWRYFWRRVAADVKNRDLIPLKVLFFFKYATLFVLYPFLTLHMAELGLDEWEIGINQATAPIVAISGPPLVGVLADRIGNFKILLSIMTLLNAGVALLLIFVPVARETVTLNDFLTFEFTCNSSVSEHFILQSIDEGVCTASSGGNNKSFDGAWNQLSPASVDCGLVCEDKGSQNQMNNAKAYARIRQGKNSSPIESMNLPNGETVKYFNGNNAPRFACTQREKKRQECSLAFFNAKQPNSSNEVYFLKVDTSHLLGWTNNSDVNVTGINLDLSKFSMKGDTFDNVLCHRHNQNETQNITTSQTDNGCTPKCFVQYDRNLFCSNKEELRVYNVGLTFGVYTLLRIALGFFSATSFVMFEGAVLAIMKQFGGDYGLQRVFATLAAITVAPLSGTLLNVLGFRPVICLYAFLKAVSAFVTLAIDLEFKKPAQRVFHNLKGVLSNFEILIFLVAMLWSGTVWGYLETFLFLYLQKMGGSKFLMGLTVTVGGIAGIPLLIFSRPIIKRFGHVNILCVALLFHCFRYFGYSIINNPWQALIFEAMEAVTASLGFTAASMYAVTLSNLDTIASIQGIFGCLYFGVGRGAGSFIGGLLIKEIGHVQTFRVFGIGSLIGCILYFLVNIFYLRKHSTGKTRLDVNNLKLHYHKDEANHTTDEKGEKPEVQVEGGVIGPLEVNQFTDIPLDEGDDTEKPNPKEGFRC